MKKKILMSVLLLLASVKINLVLGSEPNITFSSDSSVSFVANTLFGNVMTVRIQGHYAYISNGPTFSVVDISNPSVPVPKSYVRTSTGELSVFDNYAYIPAFSDSLIRIIDISDPSDPKETVTFHIAGQPTAVALSPSGMYLYVLIKDGLVIVDVSDIMSPKQVGSYHIAGFGVDGISVTKDRVYIGNGIYGFVILDVSDPANPKRLGEYSPQGIVNDVCVSNGYAYVTSYHMQKQIAVGELHVVDVTNPVHPIELGSITWSGVVPYHLVIVGEYAYLASSGRFSIVNISNPCAPEEVSYYETSAIDIAVSDSIACIAAGRRGLQIFDISDPTSPQFLGYCYAGDQVLAVIVRDNYAYVAYGYRGLRILDVSDPYYPFEVGYYNNNALGSYDTGAWIHDLLLIEHYAYLLDRRGTLYVIDISMPTNPQKVAEIDFGGRLFNICRYGGYAYISSSPVVHSGRLHVLDISNPANPTLIYSLDTGSEEYSAIFAKEGYLYCGTWVWPQLTVFNLTDPAQPEKLSEYKFDVPPWSHTLVVHEKDQHAFVSVSSLGLAILDVSDPRQPEMVATLPDSLEEERIFSFPNTTFDRYLYLLYELPAAGKSILRMYKMSDSGKWSEMGYSKFDWAIMHEGFSDQHQIYISDSHYMFIAAGWSGLVILKFNLPNGIGNLPVGSDKPEQFSLSQNYPNPFNSETTITYRLPQAAKVNLRVYNLLGQQVCTLVDELQKSGSYTAHWDGRDDQGLELPSGLYFYRLRVDRDKFVETKKMLLLK